MFKPTLPPLNPELLLSIAMNYSYPLDILFISIFLLIFIIAHVPLSHSYRRCFRYRCCLDTSFIFCFHFFVSYIYCQLSKVKELFAVDKIVRSLFKYFARHGIPEVVISDNGPQFSSEAYEHWSHSSARISFTGSSQQLVLATNIVAAENKDHILWRIQIDDVMVEHGKLVVYLI